MKIRPLGFYVLIDVKKVEKISKGGIVLPDDLIKKEQQAEEFGRVIAFGPVCYQGLPGLEFDPDKPNKPYGPAAWGVKVGDFVEFRRHEGKVSTSEYEQENQVRYIPDTQIIGVIDE